MKETTAQRFGFGKSFQSPSAAAAVLGAALLASGTTDDAETAWSPAAACLLPDVLPVAGTLLSYGGNRQLAAGGTVTHSGALNLGANALTVGAITASGNVGINRAGVTNVPLAVQTNATSSDGMYLYNSSGILVSDFGVTAGGHLRWRFRDATSATKVTINTDGVAAAIDVVGAITASGNISTSGSINGTSILCDGSTVFDTSGYRLDCGVAGGFNTLTVPVLLQLGGTTSSYPAIKRSGTTTAFRLADDSADGPISCAAITASGAIQETPTQSALDPTTTNIPSGKRMGWYNSTLSEFRDWVNIGGTLLKSAAYT